MLLHTYLAVLGTIKIVIVNADYELNKLIGIVGVCDYNKLIINCPLIN